jgi:DNA polymerase-3 subunit gamma/tau
VKFIFATTEIRKVPVTVLSRCQRFDLRRIEAGCLVELMQGIVKAEGISVEDQALRMIARAAEGSARDALSLLDQAIAHAAGTVQAEMVGAMLGLADRAVVIDLYEEVMSGKIKAALDRLKALYDVGADPAVVLEDLAAFTHLVTRLKLAPGADEDEALSEEERSRGQDLADKISLRALTRAWQMLLKGIDEVRGASRPLAAADMVLVRLAYAADLPTPDEALRALQDGGGARGERPPTQPALPEGGARMATSFGTVRNPPEPRPDPLPITPPETASRTAPRLASFAEVVVLCGRERDLKLKHALETYVRPIRFDEGRIELALTEDAAPDLVGELSRKLEDWTGRRWMIAVGRDGGAPTVEEARRSARERLVTDARADPTVAAVLARFPGAEIVDVRVRAGESESLAVADAAPLTDPDEISDGDD